MRHLKKFEDLDHLQKLRQDMESNRAEQKLMDERKELTHTVLQALIHSESKFKTGFENFRTDLKDLLSKYPIEELPKSGPSIYRKDAER
jgi:hypothetical protein